MYEQSAGWNEYYREGDPAVRRRMLDELMMSEPDDGANMFRLRLWEARHREDRRGGGELDRFLFQFVNLVQLYRTGRTFRRSARRQIRQALSDMLFEEAAGYGEAGERALYWELRNAAARFFKTCEGPGYNRGLFGFIASSDFSRSERICREVWEMTEGLVQRTGMGGELRLWCEAVRDAYAMFDAGGPQRLEAYAMKNR